MDEALFWLLNILLTGCLCIQVRTLFRCRETRKRLQALRERIAEDQILLAGLAQDLADRKRIMFPWITALMCLVLAHPVAAQGSLIPARPSTITSEAVVCRDGVYEFRSIGNGVYLLSSEYPLPEATMSERYSGFTPWDSPLLIARAIARFKGCLGYGRYRSIDLCPFHRVGTGGQLRLDGYIITVTWY